MNSDESLRREARLREAKANLELAVLCKADLYYKAGWYAVLNLKPFDPVGIGTFGFTRVAEDLLFAMHSEGYRLPVFPACYLISERASKEAYDQYIAASAPVKQTSEGGDQ